MTARYSVPPPYSNIANVYLVNYKHAESTFDDYNGNAKPGQLVVNTDDYSLWIGNALGELTKISYGNGDGAPGGPVGAIQYNFGNGLFAGSSALTTDGYNVSIDGNITPLSNNTSSLGTPTEQWKDLYVSNSTIYFDNVPLTVDGDGQLTFDGNSIVTTSGSGNTLSVANISVTGNIVGGYFYGDGSNLSNVGGDYGNSNVANYLPTYTGNVNDIAFVGGASIEGPNNSGVAYLKLLTPGDVRLGNDAGNVELWAGNPAQIYVFGEDGNITLPTNTASINFANGSPWSAAPVNTGNIVFNGDNIESSNNIVNILGNNYAQLQSGNTYMWVEDGTASIQVGSNTWEFTTTGITAPGNISATGTITGANIAGDGSGLTNLPAPSVAIDSSTSNIGVMLYSSGLKYTSNATIQPSTGNISTVGNVSAGYFIGNGSQLTNLPVTPASSLVNGSYTVALNSVGNLTLPPQNVGNATAYGTPGESTYFRGTRKIVGGALTGAANPFSVELNAGGTPTVAYTSSSFVYSVKITFAIQSGGSAVNWEQFDVVATPSQDVANTVNYAVSNRIKSTAAIEDTAVTATMNVSNQIVISLNMPASQTLGYASFDAVEFGTMVD